MLCVLDSRIRMLENIYKRLAYEMKKIYDLKKDSWREDFFYAYGPQAKDTERTFTDRDSSGALIGDFDEKINGYDYISAITKEKLPASVTATVKCTYRNTGAPLIVFSDDFAKDGDALRYVLHYEVVAYKGGCNIWKVIPRPETPEWPVKSTKIAFAQFPIAEDEEIVIRARIEGKTIFASVNGNDLTITEDDIPESFHIGFTACEGFCSFSEFSIED